MAAPLPTPAAVDISDESGYALQFRLLDAETVGDVVGLIHSGELPPVQAVRNYHDWIGRSREYEVVLRAAAAFPELLRQLKRDVKAIGGPQGKNVPASPILVAAVWQAFDTWRVARGAGNAFVTTAIGPIAADLGLPRSVVANILQDHFRPKDSGN